MLELSPKLQARAVRAEPRAARNAERHRIKQWVKIKILVLVAILVGVYLASFNVGQYAGISTYDTARILISQAIPMDATWPKSFETVVLYMRFPRITAAVIIGAALALSGAAYQTVFKNPLVSPDVLGASAGASLGAAVAMFADLGAVYIQVFAFTFALGAVTIAYLISKRITRDPTLALILSGMFIASLASAVVSLIKFLADPRDKLPAITYWLMGSLANSTLDDLKSAGLIIVCGAAPLLAMRWRLNVLSMGEDEAKALGIETKHLRVTVIVSATVLTAAAISIGGLIGWVGLVIPHLMRMLVGPDNKVLMPASLLGGGIFLLLVDNVARSIASTEIPLGVLTAIVGAPFFIGLMMRWKDA